MTKASVTRNYLFADSTLILKCNNTHHFMVRDAADFNTYNVLAVETTLFRTETSTFEEFLTDEELLGLQAEATEVKDNNAENLRVAIREMMSRVESKFGANSAKTKRFGASVISELDDQHLLACGRRVKRVASLLATDLATKGVTQAMITAIGDLNTLFEDALDKQSDAIANRDIATEDRIEMGNNLYAKLVDYCNMGKTIWITKDEAKYNDYVIYNTPNSEPPAEAAAV